MKKPNVIALFVTLMWVAGCGSSADTTLPMGDAGTTLNADQGPVVCPRGYAGDLCEDCSEGFAPMNSACVYDLPPYSGLELWLDAEAGVVTSPGTDRVTIWADRRGSLVGSVMATGDARPQQFENAVGGLPGVLFDGVDDAMTAEGFEDLNSTQTVIWVARPLSSDSGSVGSLETSVSNFWQVAWNINDAGEWEYLYRSNVVGAGDRAAVTLPTANAYALFADRVVGPRHSIRGSGGVVSQDDTVLHADDLTGTHRLVIGDGPAGNFDGVVLEILLYSRVLSLSERAEVLSYLRGKWGVD